MDGVRSGLSFGVNICSEVDLINRRKEEVKSNVLEIRCNVRVADKRTKGGGAKPNLAICMLT